MYKKSFLNFRTIYKLFLKFLWHTWKSFAAHPLKITGAGLNININFNFESNYPTLLIQYNIRDN